MEGMNKTKAVMLHLEERGRINSLEAIQLYGATRLSAIIYNLRHKYEMNIINEREYFTDRYGSKAFYDNYILIKTKSKSIYQKYILLLQYLTLISLCRKFSSSDLM